MKLSFYQIPTLFVDNASYLGELIELENTEVNVDLRNISNISLLLPNEFEKYNYIKVEYKNKDYFYLLDTWDYYNNEKLTFRYKIDIIRTLHESNHLSNEVTVQRSSTLLDMNNKQLHYFWKNQSTKLGADLIKNYFDASPNYSPRDIVQRAWGNTKWVYVWLQPSIIKQATTTTGQIPYQYYFDRSSREDYITVNSYEIPLNRETYRYKWSILVGTKEGSFVMGSQSAPFGEGVSFWNDYPINQLYYVQDLNRWYRYEAYTRTDWVVLRGPTGSKSVRLKVQGFRPEAEFEQNIQRTYFNDLPIVPLGDASTNLHCLVFPTKTITVERQILIGVLGADIITKTFYWGIENFLPYIFDVESENSWGPMIADIKISNVSPVFGDSKTYRLESDDGVNPKIIIPASVPGTSINDLAGLNTLYINNQAATVDGETITLISPDNQNIIYPALRYKQEDLVELQSPFTLPTTNKQNVVFKKYYLSIAEDRVELDIPLLNSDGATQLYMYDDIGPGRNNTIVGFANPDLPIQERIYYLLRSPSSLFLSRDNTLPIFTSSYAAYSADNKNFIQQAELQRKTALYQGLVSGSAGASGSAITYENPAAGMLSATGEAANAVIRYQSEKKLFNWQLDNLKSASGSYKAASSTISLMLSLGLMRIWLEEYETDELDINIYNRLIDDIGFEYFDYSYTLSKIIEAMLQERNNKYYLQARLTGITAPYEDISLPLINILYDTLLKGVNIFI